jgi:hypothetical protein
MWDGEGEFGSPGRNDGGIMGCGGTGLKRRGGALPCQLPRACTS